MKIRNNLHGKSVILKVSEGSTIGQNLLADADTDVQAAGQTLATESQNLDTKNSANTVAHNAAVAANTALHAQETIYDDAYKAASSKLQEKYPKNVAKWQEEGFAIANAKTPTAVPVQVSNLSVTLGDSATTNDLHWDAIKGISAFKIAMCTGDVAIEANWKPGTPDICTKSSVTETVLTSTQTWFRVCAINSAGQGPWSNPAKVNG